MSRLTVADMHKGWIASLEEAGKLRDAGDGVRYAAGDEPNARGFVQLTIWVGGRAKPAFNYLVKPESIAHHVEKYVASAKLTAARKAERSVEKKGMASAMREKIVVGTILEGSWGYDQTNVELFEVVEKPTAASVVIREVAHETVPGSEGFMSCSVLPVPGKYVGEPIRKVIGAYGVSLGERCTLRPTDAKTAHYSSWYA